MSRPFYLTTTLPYVNAEPHLGFALEIVQADILARYHSLLGDEVFFNTGTDEHGIKIYRRAKEEGKAAQAYVDEYAAKFSGLKEQLGLYPALHFIRTTDPHHVAAAQEFWRRCEQAGDIYKKEYETHYCVGCELSKTKSELNEAGRCPVHPDRELETIREENYFFRFSKYQDRLLDLYDQNPEFVVPAHRLKELRTFVAGGLEDFSISRLAASQPWGVAVPGDDSQTMYVWFDALVNYISTLGWPHFADPPDGKAGASRGEPNNFEKFWPGVQIAGKDNLRQQAAMWQAMLMSVGIPNSKQIMIHGFITSGGQKMSKSLGNVINPLDLVAEYGTDAVRYFLARHVNSFEDSDVTPELFREAYNANLANGLGNLVSRVMKMAVDNNVKINKKFVPTPRNDSSLEELQFGKSLNLIWQLIGQADGFIQVEQPFKTIKSDRQKGEFQIQGLLWSLWTIAYKLEPFMPETSATIRRLIEENKISEKPLFGRK